MKKGYIKVILAACAGATLLIGASSSQAQECENDNDCPSNYACQVVGGMGCQWNTCPEGDECTQPEDCEPQNITSCVALPCSNDDQCAEGMVCHESSWEECRGTVAQSCSSEEECEELEPEPVQCVTHTQSECVPIYALPCQVNADCGEGFTCEELERCRCNSGNSGAGGSTGTVAPDRDAGVDLRIDAGGAEEIEEGDPEDVPLLATDADNQVQGEEPSCVCEPSGEFRCAIIETECSSESDCPTGWTCEANPNQPSTCGGAPDMTSEEITCEADPNLIARICMPPYYNFRGITEVYSESLSSDQGPVNGDSSESPEREDTEVGGAPGSTPPTVEKPSVRHHDKNHGGGCRVANIGGASEGILPFFTYLLGFLFLWRGRRHGESSRTKWTQ